MDDCVFFIFATHTLIITVYSRAFIPKANFGHLVLLLPASVYVHLYVSHLLVHAMTHHPFKLGSPNLDKRCKRPCLTSLLFCGVIDQDQIELRSQNLPYFRLVHTLTPHHLKVRISVFEPKMNLITVVVPIDFGLYWHCASILFLISKSIPNWALCLYLARHVIGFL